MDGSGNRGFRWRWRRVVLSIGIACLLSIAAWVVALVALTRDRDALLDELRRDGQPTTWKEVVAREQAESPEDSGAKVFMKASAALQATLKSRGESFRSLSHSGFIDSSWCRPVVDDDITGGLAAYEPVFRLIAEAVGKPPGLLSKVLDEQRPFSGTGSSRSGEIVDLLELLHLDVLDALGRQKPARAYRSLALAFGVLEQTSLEHLHSAQHIRLAMLEILLEKTFVVALRHSTPDDRDFAAIDDRLQRLEQDVSAGRVLLVEGVKYVDLLDGPPARLAAAIGPPPGSIRSQSEQTAFWLDLTPVAPLKRIGSQSAVLQYFILGSRLADQPLPYSRDDLRSIDRLYSRLASNSMFASHVLPHDIVRSTIYMWNRSRQRASLARLALRLARFRSKNSRFPTRLDEVCDATMPALPVRWFAGKTPVYGPYRNGFTLKAPPEAMIDLPGFANYWLHWTIDFPRDAEEADTEIYRPYKYP